MWSRGLFMENLAQPWRPYVKETPNGQHPLSCDRSDRHVTCSTSWLHYQHKSLNDHLVDPLIYSMWHVAPV